MKILILTPVYEIGDSFGLHMMAALTKNGYDAFSTAAFANYLLAVKLAKNEEEAIIKALITSNNYAAENKNCIIIGNSSRNIKYDVIIEVNVNHEEGVSIEDRQLSTMRTKYEHDQDLAALLSNYECKDAESHLGGSVEQIVAFIAKIWNTNQNKTSLSKA